MNSLDRFINWHGYSGVNAVACCYICNYLKGDMANVAFKELVWQIATFWPLVRPSTTLPRTNRFGPHHVPSTTAKSTPNQKAAQAWVDSLGDIHCYLYFILRSQTPTRKMGVDRIASSHDYPAPNNYPDDNCKPCCWPCNDAKSDMRLFEFLGHTQRVFLRLDTLVVDVAAIQKACVLEQFTEAMVFFPKVKRSGYVFSVRPHTAVPVVVVDQGGKVAAKFWSIAEAAEAVGLSQSGMRNVLTYDQGAYKQRWYFRKVFDEEYIFYDVIKVSSLLYDEFLADFPLAEAFSEHSGPIVPDHDALLLDRSLSDRRVILQ